MRLNIEKIREITIGAVEIKEKESMISLERFTEEQKELYKSKRQNLYNRTLTASGIKFSFKTDSKNLFVKLKACSSPSRKYFSLDVFVNGIPAGFIDNFSDIDLPQDYTEIECTLGEFSKNFQLGEGMKQVCVHLPWSVEILIEEICVDDNAVVEGVKPKKKLLVYGDSITQGYDALRPSCRYTAKLADKLEAEEFNKAIGGEVFFPDLALLKDSFVPDYITVAYGTNDWCSTDEETFKYRCKSFYSNLSQNYQKSKIFAISPIWRKDMRENKIFGDFEKIEETIRDAVCDIENITVISGFEFVPRDEKYYADLRLHPNDEGFEYYAENLYNKIKLYI